jgi:hypothetical protein
MLAFTLAGTYLGEAMNYSELQHGDNQNGRESFFFRGKMDVKVNHEEAIVRPSLFILVPEGIRSKFKTTHHSGL